ncbi:aldolase catalytic domain-containing protein [Saccharospirillum salsuginis]|uniref:Pyruvate carboxyltransferase domain-containing protein n=1 Tax=Saccharospirillum salsuginis TaxID=418750 RepID=A0A918NCL6_9GAMM|nr:aldolase catalytic domain-containing protein [Saccharospirillum salsuginis]GGX60322.1 hypothetical protein GCM10007392_30430 [Saccharospirillum salsuginis]
MNSIKSGNMTVLDCTLRDGGYYNNWDFDFDLINKYIQCVSEAGVDVIEIGFRSLSKSGFKGACAYSTDEFIDILNIPDNLMIGVMVNASELLVRDSIDQVLPILFPRSPGESRVNLVRIACHAHEFTAALEAVPWLKERGFKVGFNLMQVSERTDQELYELAAKASDFDVDVLYFADSLGSMKSKDVANVISSLKKGWKGDIGIHAHNNMGQALDNTLAAMEYGARWIDATVTGMGRGPGNAKLEEVLLELSSLEERPIRLIPLTNIVNTVFEPLRKQYGWGSNFFYFLAGKYSIHPTYIQEMIQDARYREEDILAVIEHLRQVGGEKFKSATLDVARSFYNGEVCGNWSPKTSLKGKDVLILGAGPSVSKHKKAIESFIDKHKPVVIALNTQSVIQSEKVDLRAACHPVRLLADCESHLRFKQPLITPYSMLPDDVKDSLINKEVFDFGISVSSDGFEFFDTYCIAPNSLVMGYVLSVCVSGQASKLYLAGFDGFSAEDPRYEEIQSMLSKFYESESTIPMESITPTRFTIPMRSIYSF